MDAHETWLAWSSRAHMVQVRPSPQAWDAAPILPHHTDKETEAQKQ